MNDCCFVIQSDTPHSSLMKNNFSQNFTAVWCWTHRIQQTVLCKAAPVQQPTLTYSRSELLFKYKNTNK